MSTATGAPFNGSDVATLRTMNARTVLVTLRDATEPCSVSMLADATGLSRPTVEAVLTQLVGLGLAHADATRRTGATGRPARTYGFAADAGCVIGIDAGPHGVVGLIADLAGAELASSSSERDDLHDPLRARAAVEACVDELVTSAGMSRAQVRVLSLGVPGIVDADGALWKSVVVPGWIEADLAGDLRRSLPEALVRVDNDSNLAALAEYAAGTVPGVDDLVCVLLGHRVGAGLIVGGQLVRGHRGAAAEIGALDVLRWGAAVAALRERMPTATIEECFAGRTAEAREAVAAFAEDIALGLSALVLAVAPRAVVVGGGVSRASEVLLAPLRRELAVRCLYEPLVVQATHGKEATVRGALIRALEVLVEQVILPSVDHAVTTADGQRG